MRDRAIPIFEAQYPTSKVLFAFDNAASHAAFATDDWRMKDGTVHPMCFPETHPDVTLRGEREIELKCYPLNHVF